MKKEQSKPKRQTAQANPRPTNEFCLCLRCARWGLRSPDPDCSHVERIDLTNVGRSDVEFFEELAERIARDRVQTSLRFSMLRNDAKRLVNQGKARMQDVPAPPSSGIVRLTHPTKFGYKDIIPNRDQDRPRIVIRIATAPANDN